MCLAKGGAGPHSPIQTQEEGRRPWAQDRVVDSRRPSGRRRSCLAAAAAPRLLGPQPPSLGLVSRAGNGSRTVEGRSGKGGRGGEHLAGAEPWAAG